MADQITASEYNSNYADWPIIDVRSPGEYKQGHIVGAKNIPLFSDEERAIVGTLYKQTSKERAIEEGRRLVAPKLVQFVTDSRDVSTDNKVIVQCWRGGMRSQAFADHLLDNGFSQALTIRGGYKAFRAEARTSFEQTHNYIVLSGYTGSGKTAILHELAKRGEQIIDLEGSANHKGSSFGGIGESAQPSTEHFHNLIYEDLRQLDSNQRIWIEDESAMVGKVNVPMGIYNQMKTCKTIAVEIDREIRAARSVIDYAGQGDSLLEDAIRRIGKRMGGQHMNEALALLAKGNYMEVAKLCLVYYDKYYQKSVDKRIPTSLYKLKSGSGDAVINAEAVIAFADKNNL